MMYQIYLLFCLASNPTCTFDNADIKQHILGGEFSSVEDCNREAKGAWEQTYNAHKERINKFMKDSGQVIVPVCVEEK